jgi:hypothetical protein
MDCDVVPPIPAATRSLYGAAIAFLCFVPNAWQRRGGKDGRETAFCMARLKRARARQAMPTGMPKTALSVPWAVLNRTIPPMGYVVMVGNGSQLFLLA